jgi:hypothetical protein
MDAFEVRRLIELSKDLSVKMIDPERLAELDLNHWYFHTNSEATPRSLLEHMRLIPAAVIGYPIILDKDGRIMDGMHRVLKALLDGVKERSRPYSSLKIRSQISPTVTRMNCPTTID